MLEFRPATIDDLPSVVALTAELRGRLATWAPRWWRPSGDADAIHRMWLEHLVTNAAGTLHVASASGDVVGCFAVNLQARQWFVDDLAVSDPALWPALATGLVGYVEQRPALACSASQDGMRAGALEGAGCKHVSSYWIRETASGTPEVGTVNGDVVTATRPQHTFGGKPFDHTDPGALAFATDDGSVIGSPSTAAPPIYDPGGTVTVVDFVDGPHLDRLLDTTLRLAGNRGDVLLCAVCGIDDHTLAEALTATGFTRTVDVFRLPQ